MKKQFCSYCGTKLDDGARFCKNCGETVGDDNQGVRSSSNEPSQTTRKMVYEGTIHKCPNCGEVMESFLTICPTCGYEVRGARSSSSVRELAAKLEALSAQKMPDFKENKSVMKMIFGKDFKEGDAAKEALERFEGQKSQEMASLIINFGVPNTKEDIMEFMLLAASHINVDKGIDDDVTKAWISKLDQVYQRAEISLGEQPEFIQIQTIYDRKKKEIQVKKLKTALILIGLIAIWFFFFGLLWDPFVTIVIAIGILIVSVTGIVLYMKR